MSERLTKRKEYGCACWNGDQNLVTHKRYSELLDAMAKYEDVIFDADGNEVISLDRLRELAEAEREGRVIILGKAFKEPNGMFTTLVYNKSGLLMGRTDETAEESERNAAALAREPKGDAT